MKCRFLLLFLLVSTCVPAQVPDGVWKEEDTARYARERSDSSLWDQRLFQMELDNYRYDSSEVQAALSFWPIPTPAYDWGYVSLRTTNLHLGHRNVAGASIAYAYDEYRPRPTTDTLAFYQTYCTVYILSDRMGDDAAAFHIVSRNYPHYLTTGTRLTSVGEVDFVHMTLVDGHNFAIVNQRYFDLAYGSTILVAPMEDGSMRLLQLDASPGPIRAGQEQEAWNQQRVEAYERQLETDARVIAFFNQPGVLVR